MAFIILTAFLPSTDGESRMRQMQKCGTVFGPYRLCFNNMK